MADYTCTERSETLTDWIGNLLDRNLLQYVTVGNIVRIKISNNEYDWCAYFKIISKNDDDLVGVVADPYIVELDSGLTINFKLSSIREIPLDWEGNEQLNDHVIYTGYHVNVTGLHELHSSLFY